MNDLQPLIDAIIKRFNMEAEFQKKIIDGMIKRFEHDENTIELAAQAIGILRDRIEVLEKRTAVNLYPSEN